MGWLSKLSELHVKLATLFDRYEVVAKNVEGLAENLNETAHRVARVEGVVANSLNSEILRRLDVITDRINELDQRLQEIEIDSSIDRKRLPHLNTEIPEVDHQNRVLAKKQM